MASIGCLHPAEAFCYFCGQFIKTRVRKYSVKACRKMCEAYKTYLRMPVRDQDKSCLKAMLLHNGNNYPSFPMAHSVHLKEDYTSVKMLLSTSKYDDYGWEMIGDFIMVLLLMGLQGGFTKFPCFLCLWDTRNSKAHYHRKDWPQQTEFSMDKSNVKWDPLIEPQPTRKSTHF